MVCKGVFLMNVTIRDAYDQFLQYGAAYLSPRTLLYYRKNIGYFLNYLETVFRYNPDQCSLQELPSSILFDYLVWLRSKERYAGHPLYAAMDVHGSLRANTVNSYMRAVKAFFNYLYRNGFTEIRYTEGLRLPKSDQDQIVVLTQNEVDRIDRTFDLSVPLDLRNYCMIHLMLDAGLRRLEVINLTVQDVRFDSNAIVINRSKGSKSRLVILCPRLADPLRRYFDLCRPANILFFRHGGSPVSDSAINRLFINIRRRSGVTRIYPHLLRHTFATSYIMGGGNLEMLRILLGHFDYSITRTYLHLAAQNQILNTDIYRLDPVFFKSGY